MKRLIFISLLLLAGCSTTKPEPIVVQDIKFIKQTPPAALLTPPPAIPAFNGTSQADVASFLVDHVNRETQCTNQLNALSKWYKEQE